MWIVRYQYEMDDGTSNSVSFCLDSGGTYTIGRSSKSQLLIKNDKSISREHIRLNWKSNESCLWMENKGKLTAANGRYLKVNEAVTFKDSSYSSKPLVVQLGTKPVKVELAWQNEMWNIPSDISTVTEILNHNGISVSTDCNQGGFNILIMSEDIESDWHRCLFGLLNSIKIMHFSFLSEVCKILAEKHTNLWSIWSKLVDGSKFIMYENCRAREMKSIFRGIQFYLVGDSNCELNYVRKSIEAGGGIVELKLNNIEGLDKEINNADRNKFIIIKLGDRAGANGGFRVHTLKDLVESVIKDQVDSLVSTVGSTMSDAPSMSLDLGANDPKLPANAKAKVDQKSTGETAIKTIDAPITKKRRLNRQRITPLDSLAFFAGGESVTNSPSLQLVTAAQSNDQTSHVSASHSQLGFDASQGGFSPDESKLNSPTLNGMNFPEAIEDSEAQEGKGEETAGRAESEVSGLSEDINAYNHSNLSVASAVDETSKPPVRQQTLDDYRGDKVAALKREEQHDLVQVIQETKNREVKRLNTNLKQVDEDELTADAINKLGSIALVEENSSLIRKQPTLSISNNDSANPEWRGRKNFKTFKKVLPKYKQNQVGIGHGHEIASASFIRSSGFLIARDYVPLKSYLETAATEIVNAKDHIPNSADTSRKSVSPHSTVNPYEEHNEQSFTFSRNGSSSNALFVVDEDDSQMVSLHEPDGRQEDIAKESNFSPHVNTKKRPKITQHTIEDDDDDEDDDGPKFKFRRRNLNPRT